jgi:tellurite resistance protein
MTQESAEIYMRGAMLMALADGVIDRSEKRLLRKLQKALGMEDEQVSRLVAAIKDGDRSSLEVPESRKDRQAALEAMILTAQADGEISPEESALLERVAGQFGITGRDWSELYRKVIERARSTDAQHAALQPPAVPVAPDRPEVHEEVERLIESFYSHSHEWTDARERGRRFIEIGRASVLPLIRAFESYRSPSGGARRLYLKALFAEFLGDLGDVRAVHYLASQLELNDESEVSNARLREATAAAIGRIVGKSFARDAHGVVAARLWWRNEGMRQYRELAY